MRNTTLTCELSWAAGFFDGEGSIYVARKYVNGQIYKAMTIRVGQSGHELPEVLTRFQNAMGGIGKFSGPFIRPANRLPSWYWRVDNRRECEEVIEILLPHLSTPKRDDAFAAMEEMESYDDLRDARASAKRRRLRAV